MPFLYTASQANNYTTTNALFADKGISDLAPVKTNDLLLIGRPHQYEIAYGSYVHALPAFLNATVRQTRVSALDIGQLFPLQPTSYLPITPPPLLLKPTIPLKNEGDRMELLAFVGSGSEVTNFQEQAHITIERPIFKDIAHSLSSFDPDNRTTTNTTNLLGYKCYLQTTKILTAFLATHHYAAFQSPEQSRVSNVTFVRCPLEPDAHDVNQDIDYNAELVARGLPPVTPSMERRSYAGTIPENCDGVWSLQSTVTIAQPSPFRPDVNFGPAGGVPYLPGYLLPYFDGLLIPDQNFLPSIMRRFFLRNFGNDDASIDKAFKAWRTGHTSIFRTNSGKILSHIFLCIQAAIEAQARVFVIQSSSRYLGCAIVGYNFHLSINGIVKTPETPDSLRSLLTQLDPHEQAVAEIVEILRGLELAEAGMAEIEAGELVNGKAVWRALNSRVRAEGEDLKSLRDAVDRLSFEERYLTLSKGDILRWIRLLSSDSDSEDIGNLPMYLTSELMYDVSREHQVLAAFGPMAPSFLNLSGGRFKFPASPTDTDYASIPDPANGDKRPLERILVVGKKVPIAVSDWKKMVRSREISQNQAQRAAGYKNVAFSQGARDEIWEALKGIPVFVSAGQKRRRGAEEDDGSDDGGEGRKSKKSRTARETAANLFNDL